jgi:hypothetical protein
MHDRSIEFVRRDGRDTNALGFSDGIRSKDDRDIRLAVEQMIKNSSGVDRDV